MKDLDALQDSALKKRVRKIIVQVKAATALKDVGSVNIKKLKGSGSYYRIRVGDYRLGLVLEESAAIFIRCLHRKDIYRYFP